MQEALWKAVTILIYAAVMYGIYLALWWVVSEVPEPVLDFLFWAVVVGLSGGILWILVSLRR